MPDAFFPFTSGCPVIFGNLVSAACLPFMFIHTPTHQLASLVLASLLFPSCLIVVLKALSAPPTSLPRLAIAVNVFPAASPSTPPTQILCFAFADSGCLDPVQIDPFHRSSARQIDPPHVLTCIKPQSRQFQLGRRQVSNIAGLICKKKLNNLCHLLLDFDVGAVAFDRANVPLATKHDTSRHIRRNVRHC